MALGKKEAIKSKLYVIYPGIYVSSFIVLLIVTFFRTYCLIFKFKHVEFPVDLSNQFFQF